MSPIRMRNNTGPPQRVRVSSAAFSFLPSRFRRARVQALGWDQRKVITSDPRRRVETAGQPVPRGNRKPSGRSGCLPLRVRERNRWGNSSRLLVRGEGKGRRRGGGTDMLVRHHCAREVCSKGRFAFAEANGPASTVQDGCRWHVPTVCAGRNLVATNATRSWIASVWTYRRWKP